MGLSGAASLCPRCKVPMRNYLGGDMGKVCNACLKKDKEEKAIRDAALKEIKQKEKAEKKAQRDAGNKALADLTVATVQAVTDTKVGGGLALVYGFLLRCAVVVFFPLVGSFILSFKHTNEMPWTKSPNFKVLYILVPPLTFYYEYKRYIFLWNRKMGIEA